MKKFRILGYNLLTLVNKIKEWEIHLGYFSSREFENERKLFIFIFSLDWNTLWQNYGHFISDYTNVTIILDYKKTIEIQGEVREVINPSFLP
ncbi:MAG: hypothetical protein HeimC3_30390 [Candidatus Heimdallarchaeota archaeon LC_3]|nr:MAG: hypothetical protein HeimC3_30390 [Candidatus Heimdallarchaeota archaeon LC_3]